MENSTRCERLRRDFEEDVFLGWTEAYSIFSGIWVLLTLLLMMISMLWWWRRRENLYLKRRNSFPLLSLLCFGLFSNLMAAPYSRFSGYSDLFLPVGCFWDTFFINFPIPCLAGSANVRIVMFLNRLKFHRKIVEVLEQRKDGDVIISPESDADIHRLKYLSSNQYLLHLVLLIFLSTLLVAIIVSVVSCPWEIGGDCDNSVNIVLVLLHIHLVMVLISAAFYRYASKKAANEPDVLNIFREIQHAYFFAIPIGILGFIIAWFQPYAFEFYQEEEKPFTFALFIDASLVIFFIYTVPLQVYKSYSIHEEKQFKSYGLTLQEVLSSDIGGRLFEQYLVQEFSVQNLTFWKAVGSWKERYDVTSCDRSWKEAKNIYRRWIAHNALLQVNLPWELVQELDNYFSGEDERTVKKNIFDNAQSEIFTLMSNDSFSRFRRTVLFKEYLGTNEDISSHEIEQIETCHQYIL